MFFAHHGFFKTMPHILTSFSMHGKTALSCLHRMNTIFMDLSAITVFWLLSLIFVEPFGNFPLNDDWSFAKTVKTLYETGDYRPTGWAAMPLLSNALLGYLFTMVLGFSHDALRLSTLFMSLLGILGTYILAAELNLSRVIRFIAAFILGFNPIYFALSNTFMTDVAFTALIIISAVNFIQHLKTGSTRSYIIGTIILVIATLSRQIAVTIPLGFGIAILLRNGFSLGSILRAVFPLLISIATLILFEKWLTATGRMPDLYHEKSIDLIQALKNPGQNLVSFFRNTYVATIYLGLFLSPLLFISPGVDPGKSKRSAIALFSTIILLVAPLYGNGQFRLMPLKTGHIIGPSGIGPMTLHDTYILNLKNGPPGRPPPYAEKQCSLRLSGRTDTGRLLFGGFNPR